MTLTLPRIYMRRSGVVPRVNRSGGVRRRLRVARRRMPTTHAKSVRLEVVDAILLHLGLVIVLLLTLPLSFSLPAEITIALALEFVLAVRVLALPAVVGAFSVKVLDT